MSQNQAIKQGIFATLIGLFRGSRSGSFDRMEIRLKKLRSDLDPFFRIWSDPVSTSRFKKSSKINLQHYRPKLQLSINMSIILNFMSGCFRVSDPDPIFCSRRSDPDPFFLDCLTGSGTIRIRNPDSICNRC